MRSSARLRPINHEGVHTDAFRRIWPWSAAQPIPDGPMIHDADACQVLGAVHAMRYLSADHDGSIRLTAFLGAVQAMRQRDSTAGG